MGQNDEVSWCACGTKYSDLTGASQPRRKWLVRATYPEWGKVCWTSKVSDYCIDCEAAATEPFSNGGST
jgi:hypothetical protein